MNNYSNNTRSMNGLNNINANSGTFEEIDVNKLVVNISGTAPTVTPLSNDNNIATTAWVTTHAGGSYVTLNTSQTLTTGIKTFTNLPECSTSATTNDQLTNKNFVDGAISTATSNLLSSANAWTGNTNTFNSFLPQSNISATLGDELTNKTFVDGAISTATSNLLSSANTWTGNTNTFNSFLPQSNISATLGDELTNKTFVDGAISTATSNLLSSANTWTGNTNTFNSFLPTSTISAITGNEFTNKNYVDGAISTSTSTLLSSANTWTGNTNTFNSFLPTSTISATTGNELTNKNFVDGAISTAGTNYVNLTGTQSISGAKTFTTNTLKAEAGVTVKNGASAQNATLTHNTTTLDVIGTGDISIKPTNDFNVLTGTGKNITVSTPSTSLLQSTQTFTTGITNTSSYIALESPTTYITGLSTQPNLIIAGASGTIYGFKFTRGGTTLSAVNRINCSSTNDTLYIEINSGQNITLTDTAISFDVESTFNLVPTGTIIMTASSTVPAGYLYCNGTSVTTGGIYAKLFAVIGYTYGGAGAFFNKPDFQGCFLRGSGSQTTGGVTYTAGAVGTIQQDAVLNPLYASNEGFRSAASGARDCVSRDRITADPVDTNTGILPRFDRTATENRPVNHAVYYYIRY